MNKHYLLFLLLISHINVIAGQITPLSYANAGNWAAHPMKIFDLEIKPSYTLIGADTTQRTVFDFSYPPANAEADIFVVSPTTLIGSGSAPGTIPLDFTQKSAINLAVQLNFSYLGQIGRIYAPYYRQANLPVFTMPLSQQQQQAAIFDTAATDVLAAFSYYMTHNNNGRRVILAGHSQGSLVLAMMLRRMEQNPAQYGNWLQRIFLSALAGMEGGAYARQGELDEGWIQHIPFCTNAPDTSCLMAWQTVKEGLLFVSNIPFGNNVPANQSLVNKGLKFSTFNASTHQQWGDPLGFSEQQQAVARAIFPKVYIAAGASGVTTDWVAYDDMYSARIVKPNTSAYAISIAKTSPASDQRHDPIGDAVFADLHLYDHYIVAGDVLRLIRQKLEGAFSGTASPENALVFHLSPAVAVEQVQIYGHADIVSGAVFTSGGVFFRQIDVGSMPLEIQVSDWPSGVYFIQLRCSNGQTAVLRMLKM